MIKNAMGPIMLDVHGTSLTLEDKELLQHPLVGGLIYFTRNYESPEQIQALTQAIRSTVKRDFLIAVDHEGGRVQRFREGYSKVPAMGKIWELTQQNLEQAKALAFHCGVIIALEVQSAGIDLSFAPVLDLNGISDVIGDRAFHSDKELVHQLSTAFIEGLHTAGMKATGKHFPGHGSVKADSHIAAAVDTRTKDEIFSQDILPFTQHIQANLLDAIMPAHVIYPEVDPYSVGFSRYWLQDVLRNELGFNGVIFSDDLSMEGASSIGGYVERCEAAQQAGCDMLLLCNNRDAVIEVIDKAKIEINPLSQQRISRLLSTNNYTKYQDHSLWQKAANYLSTYSF